MKTSKTNSGILNLFEKIVRSHPLLYFITRHLIRFTNIFEQDANGVSYINFSQKINIIDVGASDGIASKFFSRKLNVNKLICFEPYIPYVKILKKLGIENIKIYCDENKIDISIGSHLIVKNGISFNLGTIILTT